MTKLCVDCKYMRGINRDLYCGYPPIQKSEPVAGVLDSSTLCRRQRLSFMETLNFNQCGPKGRHWEAKNG